MTKRIVIALCCISLSLMASAQASGGQIKRQPHKVTTSSTAKPKRKQYAPNEVINVKNGRVLTFETTQMVDLGLPSGTIWAGWNIGASNPKEIGDYYAWGETTPKEEYTLESWIKNGTQELSIIGTLRDVATVKWGKPWRMPSDEQIRELIDNCSVYLVRFPHGSNKFVLLKGPNGKGVLFPISGHKGTFEEYNFPQNELFRSGERNNNITKVLMFEEDAIYIRPSPDPVFWGTAIRAVRW